jgi:hypothetical protein
MDLATFREMTSGPGADTRQWLSMGVTEASGDSPVDFTDAGGPHVLVRLQPSGIPVWCRVAGATSGNGEGEWEPLVAGQEVVVAIPQGDERAGCVVLGRMSNAGDAFPTLVGGADPSKNNLAFRRTRLPYVFESAVAWTARLTPIGSAVVLDSSGNVTLVNGDKHTIAISGSFVGMSSADLSLMVQLQVDGGRVYLQADTAQFALDPQGSVLATPGTLSVSTFGGSPVFHVATVEATANVFVQAIKLLGVMLGGIAPGVITGAAINVAFAAPNVVETLVSSALMAAATGDATILIAAIKLAFAAQMAGPYAVDVTGAHPGVGLLGFKAGG